MKYMRGCEIKQIDIADDFYEAYRRCFAANGKNKIVAIPAFANGFFACELYLKSILKATAISATGHSIAELFHQIPEELQVKAEKEFSNKASGFLTSYSISFDELINNISLGFEFWRYVYEDANKPFEEDYPFAYSEQFLQVFLPIIAEIANDHN